MRHARRFRLALRTLAIVALWLVVTEPWGLRVIELLPFVAPGALMGLAASWIAAALTPSRWRWADGLRGAGLGAAVLPPVFAFLVALAGAGRPQHTLESLVLLAWLALGAGAVAALAGFAWRRLPPRRRTRARPRRRRRGSPTQASPTAATDASGAPAHSLASNTDREAP